MADLKQIPPETLRSIARQIGDRITEEFSSAATAAPPAPVDGVEQPGDYSPLADLDRDTAHFVLAETFEVWKLRENAADDLGRTREDLVTLARVTDTYRHQVRLVRDNAQTAVAFAQSYAKGGQDQNDRVVRDFFFSPLAAQIDEAISAADQLVPERAVTRLLCLPEFKVEALWFITLSAPAGPAPGEGRGPRPALTFSSRGVIVASAPRSFPGETMSLMDPFAFIRALSVTTRGMGLRL